MKTKRVSKVQDAKAVRLQVKDDSPRARIMAAAGELFLSRGFVRVTADDIASEVGISKATLYKEFDSKEEIVRAVVRQFMDETVARIESLIKDESLSLVERLAALLSLLCGRLARLGPLFLRDLQKSVPSVWKEIDDFRRQKIIVNFRFILEAGRRQGLFRGDIDPDLLLEMFLRLVEEFINPAAILRSGRSPAETFESVIKVFFQGILTDKGRLDFSAGTPALFEPRKEGA